MYNFSNILDYSFLAAIPGCIFVSKSYHFHIGPQFRYNTYAMKKGFTLIELLVVISIISLLASIVITATARAKFYANVASMKAEVGQIKNIAEIFYQNNNNHFGNPHLIRNTCPSSGGSVFADPNMILSLAGIRKRFPTATIECLSTTPYYYNPTQATMWVVYIQIPALGGTGTNKWCVDNTGFSGSGDNATVAVPVYAAVLPPDGIINTRCNAATSPDF